MEEFVQRDGSETLAEAIAQTSSYITDEITRRGAADKIDIEDADAVRITLAIQTLLARGNNKEGLW